MRKIINSTYATLDGVIARPQDWPHIGSSGSKGTELQNDLLFACDTVLFGRLTYEGFASVWENQSGDPYTDRINSMDKQVFSTTLREPAWQNTTVISGDVAEHAKRLKSQPGKDIVQYGFGPIAHALLEHGLLDEVRLWIHPFFLRTGTSEDLLFQHGSPARFDLTETIPLPSGIVVLNYRIAP
jgi:dihydrofolate reductase